MDEKDLVCVERSEYSRLKQIEERVDHYLNDEMLQPFAHNQEGFDFRCELYMLLAPPVGLPIAR